MECSGNELNSEDDIKKPLRKEEVHAPNVITIGKKNSHNGINCY